MANKERGEQLLVTEAGKEYVLRLTTNASCELEGLSGKLFDQINAEVSKGSLTATRWMIWASLQANHGDTIKTPEDAGRLIDECGGFSGVAIQLVKFMALNANPDPQEEEGTGTGNPPSVGAVSGTGSVSTPGDSASATTSSGPSRSVNSGENSRRLRRTTRPSGGATSTSPG